MSGISGVGGNGMNSNMIKLLNQMTGKDKSSKGNSQTDSSFQISSSMSTPSIGGGQLGTTYADGRFTAKTHGSSMGYGANSISIPPFKGLTKGEAQITEEELREQIIKLAEESAAKGEGPNDKGNELRELIEKYICTVSPDRKGMLDEATKGKTFPDVNGVLAEIVDNKTGLPIANYQPDQGWAYYGTQEERDAARPWNELYHAAFFKDDSPYYSPESFPDSQSKSNQSAMKDIDFIA